jgi:ubiquinone/menaquinone biosynthesis C-methylase UbiE
MSGWQLSGDAPSLYNRFAIRAMEQWTDDLIRQANCKDGERVLDVACGTGFVTLRIKEVSGADCELTGLDVNEGMLNAARKNPGVNWQLGSATAMPFPDASFDVVLCQQGLQYFPDRQAAMKEIARVLVPGGRVSLNVWGRIERQAFFAAFVDACAEFLGPETRAMFDLNFSLNTSEELHRLASGAGLKDAKVRFEHRTMRAPDASKYGMGFVQASPVAGNFLALSEENKQRFGAFIAKQLESYVDDAGMAVPQENHYLTAVR